MDQRRTGSKFLLGFGQAPVPSVPVHRKNSSVQPQVPHKVFVWDHNGVYRDACFPNARHGHFLVTHQTLKGAHVREVFPQVVGCRLQATIQLTWETHKNQVMQLMFERDTQHFEATVTCVATQEGLVMGFVTDRLIGPRLESRSVGRLGELDLLGSQLAHVITPRQYQVVKAVMAGWSTHTIAAHLVITERTVKKHFYDIYMRLGVANRMELLRYLSHAGK